MGFKNDISDQNDFNFRNKKSFSPNNYKSVFTNLYYIALYFVLIICFTIIAHIPKLIMFMNKNVNSYYIAIFIILTLILDLIIFTKIISIRIKWNTLFFHCSRDISWKQTLREYLYPLIIFTYGMAGIATESPTIVANSLIKHYNSTFWTNPDLANAGLMYMVILLIINFEIGFWLFILFDKIFDILERSLLIKQKKDITK